MIANVMWWCSVTPLTKQDEEEKPSRRMGVTCRALQLIPDSPKQTTAALLMENMQGFLLSQARIPLTCFSGNCLFLGSLFRPQKGYSSQGLGTMIATVSPHKGQDPLLRSRFCVPDQVGQTRSVLKSSREGALANWGEKTGAPGCKST